jgi:hypothetical protein
MYYTALKFYIGNFFSIGINKIDSIIINFKWQKKNKILKFIFDSKIFKYSKKIILIIYFFKKY